MNAFFTKKNGEKSPNMNDWNSSSYPPNSNITFNSNQYIYIELYSGDGVIKSLGETSIVGFFAKENFYLKLEPNQYIIGVKIY